jgi:hypothetical protein
MSLSDVPNPKAAADLIARTRKLMTARVCMAPMSDHEPKIVSAHTLSVESMLRKIAVDGHVYTYGATRRFEKDKLPIEYQLRGLRDVSVFNGFCTKHDRELFSCLENEAFLFRRDQLFMLAYRAAARECYLKPRQHESIPTMEEIAAIHLLPDKPEAGELDLLYGLANSTGANEIQALKAKLDELLLAKAWDRLVSHAILFSGMPTVLASSVFQPFFDMEGNKLQAGEDLKAELSPIFVSVIPLEGGGGAAIFSWQDTANAAPRRYFESVSRAPDRTAAVLHVLLDNIENVAFAPAWFEGLTPEQKDYMFSRILMNTGVPNHGPGVRDEARAPFLADWGTASAVAF